MLTGAFITDGPQDWQIFQQRDVSWGSVREAQRQAAHHIPNVTIIPTTDRLANPSPLPVMDIVTHLPILAFYEIKIRNITEV